MVQEGIFDVFQEANMKIPMFLFSLFVFCLLGATNALAEKKFNKMQVVGSYAYSFQGEISEGSDFAGLGAGHIVAAGLIEIHPDSDGSCELGDLRATGMRTFSVAGKIRDNAFVCCLTLESNGTGDASCVVPGVDLPEETFDFVIENNAKAFRYVGTTPGLSVLGSATRQ
jgi:hypothetical protein